MEVFSWYKGFGIRYYQIGGTTDIEEGGFPIKSFEGKGEIEGRKMAEKYIDDMCA
jgi:hypothetical protein